MKDSVIKFRLSCKDKDKIERLAKRRRKSVSEILRTALVDIQNARPVGQMEREALADARRSANALLQFSKTGLGDSNKFELLLQRMREDAQKVLLA